MAVVTTKSGVITGRDASPAVLVSRALQGANIQHARGVVNIANGDSATSKLLFCSVPSNAVVQSARITCPDIGTTTAMDVGLHQTTQNGGAAADVDLFGSAIALNAGVLTKSEILYESGFVTPANGEKRLWEHLGLSADPKVMYDVVGTLTGAADAAGAVLLEINYTV